MQFEIIILSKIRQTREGKFHMFSSFMDDKVYVEI